MTHEVVILAKDRRGNHCVVFTSPIHHRRALAKQRNYLSKFFRSIDLNGDPVNPKSKRHGWLYEDDSAALRLGFAIMRANEFAVKGRTVSERRPKALRLSKSLVLGQISVERSCWKPVSDL